MADQASQPSASTPSTDQISMRVAAFLAASCRLAAQPHTVSRITSRPRRNPLAIRPAQFKRGQSIESTPLPTPVISTESEKKRQDDNEVFGKILSNLEVEGDLLDAGVVNQPLSTEEVTMVVTEEVVVVEEVAVTNEVVEEETRRSTLALETFEETTQVEFYDVPIKVVLEEVATEKKQEVEDEKKKKKKKKEKKVGEGEPSHHRKEKKNKEKKEDEKDEEAKLRKKKEKKEMKERRREERRLKKEEEKKKRVASPEMDGESTSVREDRGEIAQLMEPTQPEPTQLVWTDEGEEGEATLLMRRHKGLSLTLKF
ncbi:vicilin-like seed storage protein At2g18540 [Benincasa hispida]|uniref:vicilin-like seed storage protein At2g18540 n=1 Tax=Benincasa hispida TaxID=102211 RepID=UPI0018FF426F|nr:vicilin-like seed storage protein At2g18540 [Benincasa hispida]